MQLDIITPENIVFSSEVTMATIPGSEGEFGVLEGHAPFISTLRPGVITVEAAGETRKLAVMSGIAEVTPERCAILAENIIDCASLTLQLAEEKLQQAIDEEEDAKTETAKKQAQTKRAFAEVLRQNIA